MGFLNEGFRTITYIKRWRSGKMGNKGRPDPLGTWRGTRITSKKRTKGKKTHELQGQQLLDPYHKPG
jgi:hypothetical protein